jgi:uncharacterized OsmC-like protein
MKVTLNYFKNLHFKASARMFNNIDVDEPETFHGNNNGPSPIEYYLIGIGACLGNTLIYSLKRNNINVKDLEITIDGQLKHIPPHMHLRLVNISIEFDFKRTLNISDEDLKYYRLKLEEFCPIFQSVSDGIPLKLNFVNFK